MSSPTMDRSIFAVDAATQSLPKTYSDKTAERGADAALTGRVVVAIAILGAGMWYLLWRLALFFETAH